MSYAKPQIARRLAGRCCAILSEVYLAVHNVKRQSLTFKPIFPWFGFKLLDETRRLPKALGFFFNLNSLVLIAEFKD